MKKKEALNVDNYEWRSYQIVFASVCNSTLCESK